MKNTNPQHLMIQERKRAKRQGPQPGEVVQGIAYAFFNAGQNLKAAKALYDKELLTIGFGHLITALEEIGKMGALADALVRSTEPEKYRQIRKNQKSHQWKLAWALKMFSACFDKNHVKVTIEKLYMGPDRLEGEKAIEYILNALNPNAANYYHELRISSGYTNFDGQRINSPHHEIDLVRLGNASILIDILLPLYEKCSELLERMLPIYFVPLRESFFCHDKIKVSQLKKVINHRVNRTLPAIGLHMDRKAQEHLGLHLDELMDKQAIGIEFTQIFSSNIAGHLEEIAEIITSDEAIPLQYYYPPLKDEFKAYYKQFEPPFSG